MLSQFIVTHPLTGQPVYRADGTPIVIELPALPEDLSYWLEWLEVEVSDPLR